MLTCYVGILSADNFNVILKIEQLKAFNEFDYQSQS